MSLLPLLPLLLLLLLLLLPLRFSSSLKGGLLRDDLLHVFAGAPRSVLAELRLREQALGHHAQVVVGDCWQRLDCGEGGAPNIEENSRENGRARR
jgi:hypothetical protein